MKVTGFARVACATTLFAGMLTLLVPEIAAAADPSWRPTFDVAMRWINFIILVGVIIKYSREPIKDFLRMRKGDVVSQIEELDSEKAGILEKIKAANRQGIENRARFKALKDRLVAQGETRRQQIIEQARQQSAIMLEETRRKMANRIVRAKDRLAMEFMDMAIAQAVGTLPSVITDVDNQRLQDDYMDSLNARPTGTHRT